MKKRRLSILSIIILFFFINALPLEVFAEKVVEINDKNIQIVRQEVTEQSLTNEPIELYGPYAEAQFYYELHSNVTAKDQYLQLEVAKSELLIDPSSITIKVDEEPIYSTTLAGESTNIIKVPLVGAALLEGSHTITVSFDGFVKEGICVPQYTTGNWMSIQPNSYLHIDALPNNSEDMALYDYPRFYIGSLENQVSVITPQNPSMETLQSAYIIANFLSNQSIENTVTVVQEQEVKKMLGNSIVVGGTEEFKTSWVKQLIQDEIANVKEDSLYLSQIQLKQNNQAARALVVLAKKPENILHNTDLLTSSQYYEQFSGDVIQVSELPKPIEGDANEQEITFKEIGMPNIQLDSQHTKTETYYYSLPMETGAIQNPTMELKFKRSATIHSNKETLKDKEEVALAEIELIVNINDVPYPVDVRSLEEDENGNIKALIPIDPATLKDKPLMTLQIETSGLRMDQSCVALDQNRWIQLFNDSKLIFPTSGNGEKSDMYFNNFPYPFSNKAEELTIVLPEQGISSKDMLSLFNVLTTNNRLPEIKLKQTSEIKEEDLKNGNIIFIGSLAEHDLLIAMKDDLLVNYKENVPQLSAHGFLQTEVNYYGFMQSNPWNQSYSMLVLDNLNDSNQYYTRDFLSYLQYSENNSSIAVQTGPDQFFTNTQQLEKTNLDSMEEKKENSDKRNILYWSIGFGVLIIAMFLLIIYYMKRRKKFHPDNKLKR
ncbi:cellulose biosynthesis cyclic di-GMP-binding regulatory protein BcsB [Ornithinibacillus bavariensis]|uniref:Cellulose biosynthesis cyclic di-GMP-binding regulatory protein BcsB n=1 Tax=Ornithinibacillus bavariensis TaxID=545502 RepID=A0A920C4G1_9BACI|nr:cellulose biosynthesis cyclic di-GMP-binding regulatory protein BcsB [Ornithinibacillus bavariensis]GIO25585.1 hypothetical protein J43TS3_01960 [Ornithinibacillus bavariensis]